jgi:hypothetical protein
MRYLCLIHLKEHEMTEEAIGIASRFPSAPRATIEVWRTRELVRDASPG